MSTINKYITLLMAGIIISLTLSACSSVKQSTHQSEHVQEKNHLNIVGRSKESPPDDQTFDPIVLYELTENDLNKPISEIPYYYFGDIRFITEDTLQSVQGGHSPWKTSPTHAAEILTQNLIPNGISADQVKYKNVSTENEATTVEMIVPNLGTFTITLQFPDSIEISFVTKIVWQPDSAQSLKKLNHTTTKPLVIFELEEEEHFDRIITEFPSYSNGNIYIATEENIQSFNAGHSPWLSVPDMVAEFYTKNLIPQNVELDLLKYEVIAEQGNVTTVAIVIPDFGTYHVTLLENFFQVITKIAFQISSPSSY